MSLTEIESAGPAGGGALATRAASSLEPPGPSATFNPFRMAGTMSSYFRRPIAFVGENFSRYGDIFQLRVGPKRFYFSRSPEHFHEVLVKRADAFVKGQRTGYVFREGILVSDGEHWRAPARSIQPHFSRNAVSGYFPVMKRLTQRLLDTLQPNTTFDLDRVVSRLTLDIVCESLLGQRLSGDARDRLLADLGEIERSVEYFDPLPTWFPTAHHFKLWRASRGIDRVVDDLLSHAEQEPGTLPGKLLRDLAPVSARERRRIRDQVVTMYFAGYRTSAHALVWTWYLLSNHPEVEQRLMREVDEVVGDSEPTLEHLPRLTVTARIAMESLRIRPPSYLLERVAITDVDIGGYRIRRGSELFLHIYWMHHDARWYPEPHLFLPDRKFDNANAYCPFGTGKRQCVGKSFALQEIVLAIAMVARRFRVRIAPGHLLEHRPLITLGPRAPIPGVLLARNEGRAS